MRSMPRQCSINQRHVIKQKSTLLVNSLTSGDSMSITLGQYTKTCNHRFLLMVYGIKAKYARWKVLYSRLRHLISRALLETYLPVLLLWATQASGNQVETHMFPIIEL